MTIPYESERSTGDIERDVENRRATVANRIDELEDRLAPGQLIADAYRSICNSRAADSVISMSRSAGRTVAEHPVPAALVCLGAGWLLTTALGSKRNSRPRQRYGNNNAPYVNEGATGARTSYGSGSHDESSYDRSWGGAAEGGSSYSGSAGYSENADDREMKDRVRAAGSAAVESAGDMASSARERAEHAADSARDRAGYAMSAVRESVGHAAEKVTEGTRAATGTVAQTWRNNLEDRPLLLAALGFATGATVAALLPRTTYENETVGEYGDHAREQVRDVAEEQWERAKEAAGSSYEAARAEADRQGLSVDGGRNAAEELSEKAKSVGEAAVGAARASMTERAATEKPSSEKTLTGTAAQRSPGTDPGGSSKGSSASGSDTASASGSDTASNGAGKSTTGA